MTHFERDASHLGEAMTYQASAVRTVVVRAKRDTVMLVATASAMTFALSYAVHSHRSSSRPDLLPQQAWTGALADISPQELASADAAPITSASLVVPKAELALPQAPVRPLVRLHGCDGSLCGSRTATALPPPRRPAFAEGAPVAPADHPATLRHSKPSLIARLNPLNHLPDASTLKRPFAVAGDTVAGWFRKF